MKQLILGNEAVARGLYEAGCSFVSSYPGTPSTEITEAVAKYPEVYAEWAPNEKVALEVMARFIRTVSIPRALPARQARTRKTTHTTAMKNTIPPQIQYSPLPFS